MKKGWKALTVFALLVCLAGCGVSADSGDVAENVTAQAEPVSDPAEDENAYDAELINGDFETMDFTGWEVEDEKGVLLVRNDAWAVVNTSYFVKVQAECDGMFTVSQKIRVAETDSYLAAVIYYSYKIYLVSNNVKCF